MYSKYKLVLLISVWKDHSLFFYMFKGAQAPLSAQTRRFEFARSMNDIASGAD